MVLFAPAALIAASALGLHQFFALWRVFASAVNTRSGSPAWKTVQPGAPQLAAPPVHWSAHRACSSEADKRGLRECTGRECKHHQNKPHTRAARCRGACDTDLRRACALLTAEALRVQFSALSRLDFAQLTCSCGCRHVMDVAPRVGCVAACTCPRLRPAATCRPACLSQSNALRTVCGACTSGTLVVRAGVAGTASWLRFYFRRLSPACHLRSGPSSRG